MIARLVKGKGIADYIQAARRVKEVCPNAQFAILGESESGPGAYPIASLHAAEAAGLVTYLGTALDVRPHISSARIFVLPSYYREGTPRSVLEAMAMGRPVVTTDVPGCRDAVVDGYSGIVVPPKNVPALANAILSLIQHPERAAAMGREGRLLAEARYNVGRVTESLLSFFWATIQPDRS
jgi:glycosyltransferase involved in cell wall biosynthesis